MLNIAIITKFAAVLLFVVGLIFLTGYLMRLSNVQKTTKRIFKIDKPRHIKVIEASPIDFKRKLVLVECNGQQHLLLCGAERDIVIQSMPAPLVQSQTDAI